MARTTFAVTVGTVLSDGQIAPLMLTKPDPVANLGTAADATSSTLYGLASAQLAGLTTAQFTSLVSTQMGGLTTGQTALLAAQNAITADVTMSYDTAVVTNKRILKQVMTHLTRNVLGRNDISD